MMKTTLLRIRPSKCQPGACGAGVDAGRETTNEGCHEPRSVDTTQCLGFVLAADDPTRVWPLTAVRVGSASDIPGRGLRCVAASDAEQPAILPQ